MALDAIYLSLIKNDLQQILVGARLDKIHQISKEELVINFRSFKQNYRLLLSSRPNSPRIHFTNKEYSNPTTPPMFCMLLRKYLSNSKLVNIRQPECERILFMDFDAVNEIGDMVRIVLAIEIMGRHSNIILIKDDKIIDSIKRVDFNMSSVRQVLPNMTYKLPPKMQKFNLCTTDTKIIAEKMLKLNGKVSKASMSVIGGISPIISREIAFLLSKDVDVEMYSIGDKNRLIKVLDNVKNTILNYKQNNEKPFIIECDNKFVDFSFLNILQYTNGAKKIQVENIHILLDEFFSKKDSRERIKQKSGNLIKHIMSLCTRLEKKIQIQKEELLECEKRESIKLKGDLINANLYKLKKGDKSFVAQNFYSENLEDIEIKLDPFLTPVQNLQKYYQNYKKTYTAEKFLNEQIQNAYNDLLYLDSVLDNIFRSVSDDDIDEIKLELSHMGLLKSSRIKKKKTKLSKPLKYISSDGFLIYTGKNNIQNDALTLKNSKKNDIWFHTQKIAGSHTVVVTNGKEVPTTTYTEAAIIAAYNSKARYSSNVAVDYTEIKNIKKPPSSKAGMVIYETYYTAYVTPNEEIVKKLLVK